MLLSGIHEAVANAAAFENLIGDFSEQLQNLTGEMFDGLPRDVALNTKIAAPTRLVQLFQTLDFETIALGETNPKSLTRQRGDGVKVRHIPELLNFICQNDSYDYHLLGFEEPENSLDFVAEQAEAKRLLSMAKGKNVQIFTTTHSPSFYLLEDQSVARYYISKNEKGLSVALQGKELDDFDMGQAVGEGFYLPAMAEALKNVVTIQARAEEAEAKVDELAAELQSIAAPVVLTEGRTDAHILLEAWRKRRSGAPPFRIRSCETGGENAGSGNGGAQSLQIRLKGVATDHPHVVIGLFDYDEQGISAYKLDRNFVDCNIEGYSVKRGMHGRSYAACLPVPDFREECREHKNMPIEFLFRDDKLGVQVNNSRLQLRQKIASTKVGDRRIEIPLDDVTHFKDVCGGKMAFANQIVPTFVAEDFDAFDAVFTMIEAIIRDNEQRQ